MREVVAQINYREVTIMKKKIEKKLEKIFQTMACDNPYHAVHTTAAAAAAIVAVCPIGIDAWALRLAEVLMLVSIYGHYNVKVSTSVARTIMTSGFAQVVGEGVALAALEAANAAIILHPAVGYGIKCGIAVSLIEAVGIATIKSLEGGGSPAAEALVNAMCAVGLGGDLNRAVKGISSLASTPDSAEFAAKLDEKILDAKENVASWDEALQNCYDDPTGESSGAFEQLMKGYWENRVDVLTEARKKL